MSLVGLLKCRLSGDLLTAKFSRTCVSDFQWNVWCACYPMRAPEWFSHPPSQCTRLAKPCPKFAHGGNVDGASVECQARESRSPTTLGQSVRVDLPPLPPFPTPRQRQGALFISTRLGARNDLRYSTYIVTLHSDYVPEAGIRTYLGVSITILAMS